MIKHILLLVIGFLLSQGFIWGIYNMPYIAWAVIIFSIVYCIGFLITDGH